MTRNGVIPDRIVVKIGTDGTACTHSDIISEPSGEGVKVTPAPTHQAPAGQTSCRREVESTKSEGMPEKAPQVRRKAGRPPVQTDRRILEAVIKLDAEGQAWPRMRDLLEPISRKYGGPYLLHVQQVRRLAVKAAKILGKKLVKRRHGRPWGYYRQFKKKGGRS